MWRTGLRQEIPPYFSKKKCRDAIWLAPAEKPSLDRVTHWHAEDSSHARAPSGSTTAALLLIGPLRRLHTAGDRLSIELDNLTFRRWFEASQSPLFRRLRV